MEHTYYGYPKCSTCRKAKAWLVANDVDFQEVNIVEAPPSVEELRNMIAVSGLELKKFFNVSGTKYRELNLKEKLADMSNEVQLNLLASDGMLIKRPLVFGQGKVTLGFKEDEFESVWKN